jgi:hypothetical protein
MQNIESRTLSFAALIVVGSVLAFSQATEVPETHTDADSNVQLANVAIDGETLFSVRGVTAHPADRRAQEIEDRIRTLAADPKINSNSLQIEDHPGATWITAGGQRIVAVFDEDAAVEDLARDPLAELYKARIASAIDGYRLSRRPGLLSLHTLYALGATGALIIVALLGRRTVLLLRAAFERRYRARIERFEDRAQHIINVDQVWRVLTGLLNVAWVVGIAVMLYAYLNYVLALFPWTRGFAKSLW